MLRPFKSVIQQGPLATELADNIASLEDTLAQSNAIGVMKPEESHSARDTLCRLEDESINLEEHPPCSSLGLSVRDYHTPESGTTDARNP